MDNSLPPGFQLDQAPAPGGETSPPPGFQLDEEKYGGLAGEAKAFIAGGLRGATVGISDPLITKLGIAKPSTLKGLQETNPASSFAGEAAGVVAPALVGDEAGVIGKAAKFIGTPSRAVSELGQGVTAASKVLGEVGSHAAGSAVEGAIYGGAGNSLNEYALGDPELNSQKIASNFGYGALLGGALGGTLKAAEIGAPEALGAAKDGLKSLRTTLMGTGVEGDAGLAGKLLPQNISEALGNRISNLDVNPARKIVDEATANLNTVTNNVETTIKKLNQEVRPQETAALIDTGDKAAGQNVFKETIDHMNDTIKVMRNEPEIYAQNLARKLELQRDGLIRRINPESPLADTFQALRETKQKIQETTNMKAAATSQERDSMALLDQVQRKINAGLKDPNIFGEAGSALAGHDEILSEHYKFISPKVNKPTEFQKAFMSKTGSGQGMKWQIDPVKVERALKTSETLTGQKKIDLLNQYYQHIQKLPEHLENTYANIPNKRFEPDQLKEMLSSSQEKAQGFAQKYQAAAAQGKTGGGFGDTVAGTVAAFHPIIGALLAAKNVIQKPIEHINKLAEIERMIGKTDQALSKGARAVFDPSIKLANLGKNAAVMLGTKDLEDKHQKLSDQLAQFQSNPEKMIDAIADNTDKLHGVAPKTAEGLQQSMARSVSFLASKNPIPQKTNPFDTPYQPSRTEMEHFERYLSIVEKPMHAFQQLQDGTLGPETIETLTNVYPQLYDQMKQAVMAEGTNILAKKETVPFRTKQSISLFLGSPLDTAFNPQAIQANQMAYAPKAPMQGAQKPSKQGMEKMTLADRTGIGRKEES